MDEPVRAWAELGERQATSDGERQAAQWLATELARSQLQVWQEPFITVQHPHRSWVLLLGLSLLGGLLLLLGQLLPWFPPGVGLLLTLLAGLGGLLQSLGWLELGWLLGKGESQHVIGVLPALAEVRHRLIFVTHYDTYPHGWSQTGLAGGLVVTLLLPFILVAWLLQPSQFLWGGALLLLLYGTYALRNLLREGPRQRNDAGVAAGLVAAKWAPLRHTEVWTLFTGSHGPGMAGLGLFLQRYGPLLEEATFLVLEGAEGVRRLPRSQVSLLAQRGHRVTGLTLGSGEVGSMVIGLRAMAEALDQAAGGE